MIKLDYIVPKDRFAPARECWKIDNDINLLIVRYDNYAMVSIQSTTGDIADQIYYKFKSLDLFSDLKLGISSNYTIGVPLEKLEIFLKHIEKIDRSELKEGKCY